jgi:uncharacterized protein (TIGR00255 family)
MTGFSSIQGVLPDQSIIHIELRSVNHRFLDMSFRIPEKIRAVEMGLREQAQKKLHRGKLECKITLLDPQDSCLKGGEIPINYPLTDALIKVSDDLCGRYPGLQGVNVWDLMRWPGVILESVIDSESMFKITKDYFEQALEELINARRREGEATSLVIFQKINGIETVLLNLKPSLPILFEKHREKMKHRFQEITGNGIDDHRFLQEFAIFLQKIDVDEELSRLGSHLIEIPRVLSREGPKGKHLDFLMQELQREANTLGSKSTGLEMTQAALAIKVLIEQMREQIQNIE